MYVVHALACGHGCEFGKEMSQANDVLRRVDRLDRFLLFVIPISISVVTAVAVSIGLDARLIWWPLIFYVGWVVFKAIVPTIILSLPERAIIERMRGWTYLVSLAITFLTFGIGFALFTFTVPRGVNVTPIVAILSGLLNYTITETVQKNLFRKEMIDMTEEQFGEINTIMRNALYASVCLSFGVLSIEGIIVEGLSFMNAIIGLTGSLTGFALGYYFERKSHNLSHELAVSLLNSKWYKKYLGKT